MTSALINKANANSKTPSSLLDIPAEAKAKFDAISQHFQASRQGPIAVHPGELYKECASDEERVWSAVYLVTVLNRPYAQLSDTVLRSLNYIAKRDEALKSRICALKRRKS